ncbi:MAG: Fic family protein [Endomicrobium sp.]|jgi:Fic family protein|uniref:Fic family protein n=1 Tax=Candidatus Endomicrobiellum cubanum TaxID=3242325 RepID=UPI0028230738|nr:Fic family protein [Endomicrobium sp.]
MYIYQNPKWPNFIWNKELIAKLLVKVKSRQAYLLGKMDSLGFDIKEKAFLNTITEDIIKSNEIEGEFLNTQQVRSSIARKLGIKIESNINIDRNVEGVVEMTLDAMQNYNKPITENRLFGWQSSMFPGGFSGLYKIKTGSYRDDNKGPMQVVSGAVGRQKVHYQAPCANVLKKEMRNLIVYINNKREGIDLILKSAIAHLWFVSIHPFEDGNGRIARTLSDMLLARSQNSSERFYSMSSQIKKARKSYYKVLEITQKSSLDITVWIQWFLENLILAIDSSQILLKSVLEKTEFWKRHKAQLLNERQIKMLNKMFDDFKGDLTTSKWAKITKSSQDTATRDIAGLIRKGILVKKGSARSTHYVIQDFCDFKETL